MGSTLLPDDELAAWLRLLASPGVGRDTARRLLAAFGGPQAVFQAPEAARSAVVGPVVAAGLAPLPTGFERQLQATLAWRAASPDRRVMVLGEADYPPLLLNTADPPLLLYLQGRPELLLSPSVAVVGSRQPTPQGRDNARQFAAGLARSGWTVVSGLAAGIDGAAHEGALQAGPSGGGTVAVIGTGIDVVYPRSHAALVQRIVDQGLLVSELPLGAPPLAAHFPQRNRLIAGLARGTLVVEAALRSGSLITARLAAEAGREVLVIPGSILAAQAAGCHALIRQGATLVASVDDVLQELASLPPLALAVPAATVAEGGAAADPAQALLPLQDPPAPGAAAPADDPVLLALGHDPCSLDALVARCGWPAHRLSAHLMGLELDGRVARLPGGLYQRLQAV